MGDTVNPTQVVPAVENWITLNMMDKGLYASYLSCASVVGSLLSHPFFVMTTRSQIGKQVTGKDGRKTSSFFASASALGPKRLFHGAMVSQIFNVPASVVYLWVTEQTRESCRDFMFRNYPKLPAAAVDGLQVTYSALFANLFSMAVCYPANLIVTKMVVQSSNQRFGFLQTCKNVYREHGTHGFSHGFSSKYLFCSEFTVFACF
jgi:hypothetical protein